MPFAFLYEMLPELAVSETRTIWPPPSNSWGLPPDEYGFLEMYCNEPGCDCRRVMFYVVTPTSPDPLAVIAWGWESTAFYAHWLHEKDPVLAAALKGPALNPLSPASELAPALLKLAEEILLTDPKYRARIKRHYQLFRARVDEADTGKDGKQLERHARHARRRPRRK